MNPKRTCKNLLLVASMCFIVSCKARKVNTAVSRSTDELQRSYIEQSHLTGVDSTISKSIAKQLTINQNETQTIIYPTRGTQFRYDGRTFSGSADSIKQKSKSTEKNSRQQQSELQNRRTVTKDNTKRVDSKEKHTRSEKSKQSDSKALIPGWVIALAAIIGCILLFLPFKQSNEPRKS